MSLSDESGEFVLAGFFLYGGVSKTTVEIYAFDHDPDYAFLVEVDGLSDGEKPIPPGPDGRLYRIRGTGPAQQSVEAVKQWADSQPWAPVQWDDDPPPS